MSSSLCFKDYIIPKLVSFLTSNTILKPHPQINTRLSRMIFRVLNVNKKKRQHRIHSKLYFTESEKNICLLILLLLSLCLKNPNACPHKLYNLEAPRIFSTDSILQSETKWLLGFSVLPRNLPGWEELLRFCRGCSYLILRPTDKARFLFCYCHYLFERVYHSNTPALIKRNFTIFSNTTPIISMSLRMDPRTMVEQHARLFWTKQFLRKLFQGKALYSQQKPMQ